MSRVIIIGLDGATFDVIRPWAAEGKLPTFSRLFSEGASYYVKSIIVSPEAFATAVTGKNSERHNIRTHLMARLPGIEPFHPGYHLRTFYPVTAVGLLLIQLGIAEGLPPPSTKWRASPLWSIYSEQGLDVAAVAGILDEEIQEPTDQRDPDQEQQYGEGAERLARPVHVVGPEDDRAVSPQIIRDGLEQPRFPRLGVGPDLHVLER